MKNEFLDQSSLEPKGLEEDPRFKKLGITGHHSLKPVGSFSNYPLNRTFTLSNYERVKTANVKILKAEDSNKRPQTKIKKWYMSEKLDGLRWVWDGSHFITTSGSVPFYVPSYIKELMPIGVPLDGELWSGRGSFNNVTGISNVKISQKNPISVIEERWFSFSYNVFDLPSSKDRFSERISLLKQIVEKRTVFWPGIRRKYYKQMKKEFPDLAKIFKKLECPFRFVDQIEIKDDVHLSETLNLMIDKGAEGLIVRDPKSFYESGRRPKIALKYKKQTDAEALVIDVLPTDEEGSRLDFLVEGPKGTEQPAMGKILCKLTDSNGTPILHKNESVIFKIGTVFNDDDRINYCNP
jgi:ATP-dependent DNA ligase